MGASGGFREALKRDAVKRVNAGQMAYDAYVEVAGGVSLVSGAKLPPWEDLDVPIRDAWIAAARVVAAATLTEAREALRREVDALLDRL